MKNNKYFIFFLLSGSFLFVYVSISNFSDKFEIGNNLNNNVFENNDIDNDEAVEAVEVVEAVDRVEEVEITSGSTFGKIMKDVGINSSMVNDIFVASQDVYDLSQIRLGRHLELIFDGETNQCKELNYKVDANKELCVKVDNNGKWVACLNDISYDIRTRVAGGEVKTSMYEAAMENNIDEGAIIELANAFQWSIDFAMDPRVGDTFKFIYEERYLNDEYVMPGMVLAGRYVNGGESYEVYYFEESEKNKGYFDEDGNSVQKMFLKAPVEFKYISSGYTSGRRYVEAFNVSTGHRAIDYAADYGTPIRSVGDGKVVFAGWSSIGYGNLTKIRHNSTYGTNYAHQSKIVVRNGQRVKQGQVIGYVGSTGFSTGPHLHYEMVKNGTKINPLKEVLPPGKPIKDENRERFLGEVEKYKNILNKS